MENIKRMIHDINEALDMYDEILELCKINDYDLDGKYNEIDLKRFINICKICRSVVRYKRPLCEIDNNRLLNDYCENINNDIADKKCILKALLDSEYYSHYDGRLMYNKFTLKILLEDAIKCWDYIYDLQKLNKN